MEHREVAGRLAMLAAKVVRMGTGVTVIVLALLLWDPALPPMTQVYDCQPAQLAQYRDLDPRSPDGTGVYVERTGGATCTTRWEWT